MGGLWVVLLIMQVGSGVTYPFHWLIESPARLAIPAHCSIVIRQSSASRQDPVQ